METESQKNLKSYYYSTNVKSYSVFSHWLASANASLTPPFLALRFRNVYSSKTENV